MTDVFANGQGIACKAGSGKVIAGFPDPCLSPPSPPAGPVPIPYPNTAMASDCTEGSTTVKIGDQEVMLKDKSYFKQSTGDEAATKSFGMGVISHSIQGKVYFAMWSSDVKFEGENVVRNLDITTGNHNPAVGTRSVPQLFQDLTTVSNIPECNAPGGPVETYKTACKGKSPNNCGKECREAQKCILQPKNKDKDFCCKPDTTGHHLVEVHCFTVTGGRAAKTRIPPARDYNDNHAPCTCASESRADGFHGTMHACQSQFEGAYLAKGDKLHGYRGAGELRDGGGRAPGDSYWTYGQARDAGAKALFIAAGCPEECTKKQLDAYHKDEAGIKEDTPRRTDPDADSRSAGTLGAAQQQAVDAEVNKIRGVTSASAPG